MSMKSPVWKWRSRSVFVSASCFVLFVFVDQTRPTYGDVRSRDAPRTHKKNNREAPRVAYLLHGVLAGLVRVDDGEGELAARPARAHVLVLEEIRELAERAVVPRVDLELVRGAWNLPAVPLNYLPPEVV